MNNNNLPDPGAVFPRREFLALAGLTLAATAAASLPVMAGPFDNSDFEQLIPPNKKLSKAWIKSLTDRGTPEIYTKERDELKHIGMPVGGLCCGTVYLGGDGRLWNWDIFNQNQAGVFDRAGQWTNFSGAHQTVGPRDGGGYVDPYPPIAPLQQGFAVQIGGMQRQLRAEDWEHVEFQGEYPVGTVRYSDPALSVSVQMTAYSPFIPLNYDDSALPVTVCEIMLTNHGPQTEHIKVGGWLENVCSLHTARPGVGHRINTVSHDDHMVNVLSEFDIAAPNEEAQRPDVLIDNFERATYVPWIAEGTAFGSGPVRVKDAQAYQGDLGAVGEFTVNTHSSSPGTTVEQRDSATGKLTSPMFKIERRYITFLIGGGANIEQVGMRLIVDGKTVARAGGRDANKMHPDLFDTGQYIGKNATLEIYDDATGPWGNVGVDNIVQTDSPPNALVTVDDSDYGTMALSVLGQGQGSAFASPESLFTGNPVTTASRETGDRLMSGIVQSLEIPPGKSKTAVFLVSWHFKNAHLPVRDSQSGTYYSKRFADAGAVAAYVAANYARLSHETKLWRSTWNDTTLPHWFINRTFANTAILATTTAHRFASGRFWGWEGIGCCEGTCTHVWHYAQAPGRIFPEIERFTREHVDFGSALTDSGEIGYRGEGTGPAVDGQCGRILGAYREHQMSPDRAFLTRLWPQVKMAMGFLMRHDQNHDGLLDGAQENTLDAAWFGKIAWISSLYAAALRASELMAIEMNDTAFAQLCASDLAQTRSAIESQLFNGEYFVQKAEPGRESALGTYGTCHIDQVHGQSWAWQVGLGRVLDKRMTVSALRSLYKYNFAPDVGVFRRHNTAGRPYAIEGDAGLIMATNPHNLPHPFGNSKDWQFGYFNECMSGFEHQAASHMVAEGLVQEGLAVTKAIHDRYHARLRNPYNEIECSDHYSRAMASYGTFITACGFEYDGPRGHIGFDPKIHPDDFRAPFISAEGWGTYAQQRIGKGMLSTIDIKHGRLHVSSVSVAGAHKSATVKLLNKTIPCAVTILGSKSVMTLHASVTVAAGESLKINFA